MSEVINDAYETLAVKFIQAGNGDGDGIDEKDLATIGIDENEYHQWCKENKVEHDWWPFTRWIYKKLTGQDMQPSGLRGTGFRSQYHGNQVAKALRGKKAI